MYSKRSDFVEAGGLCPTRPTITDIVPARRYLRGQNSERRQARRSSGRAADEVRVGDQSESGEADRSDDSAERAGAGG